ncbi:YfhO family protein [Croceitalea sp. P059]|uniref:YfhO family protein n=1 Tax=Croceitalea sp. P059 TaxID=3075601 RepID=UPI00288448DD|nr:YfhO family protein [Croceitalea sp. P059]MDT0539571.1 YfhO family protein [Croceitalea sp. P059]
MKLSAKTIITHLLVLGFFMIASLAYFYPVLQGKAIYQSDIALYKGMAKERNDYKETTGVESYWTNSAFGGMPTYQLGANYPHDYVKKLDRLIRFLPRPSDYLFLYFIGFYILMLCMKVEYRLAILGALGFGFSTYLIIILGVGHNAKAHALAYLPMVLGGIILVFRKKYIVGFLLTAIAMALEISANHYQMTYYFMLLVLILGIVYLIYAIKRKELKNFLSSVGILVVAVILGIATNATSLLATKQYADWSTRGKSELTINPDGSSKVAASGLDREYITQYSYGITESLDLFVPRFFGGSGKENLGKDSKVYNYFIEQGVPPSQAIDISGLYLYWGEQPIVAGPAYLGAAIFFLFILSLFLVKGKKKWWLLSGVLLSLLLSWGKNFPVLTNFMIDYFPLYNKFRAVSSIQVILELCVPILAILGLKEIFKKTVDQRVKLNALKLSVFVTTGLAIAIFLMKGLFDFEGATDERFRSYFGDAALEILRSDREAVYISDTFRSLIYVLLCAGAIFLFLKEKVKKNFAVILIGLFLVVDLVGVNLRYVNTEDFVRQRAVEQPFQASEVDQEILKDQGVFRVFDPQEGLNGSRTSYFHKSLGGYHAAKPRKMEELVEYHLYKNNLQVLNMLNVKYIVQQDEEGRSFPGVNPDTNGNAWFVQNIVGVNNADEEIKALDTLNTKEYAVFNKATYADLNELTYQKDSLASINLIDFRPNLIKYKSSSANDGFAVFSEMHYPHGWVATIDDKKVAHFRVNYALRGLQVPAGEHEIEFSFEPKVVQTGSTIALVSNILLGLLLVGGIVIGYRKPKKED